MNCDLSSVRNRLAALFWVVSAATLLSCHGGDWEQPTHLGPVTVSPISGTYTDPDQSIVISSPDPGSVIKYTTDGTNPLYSGSTRTYSGPLRLGGSGVVELRVYATDGHSRSVIDSFQFVFPIPWVSPAEVTWDTVQSRGRSYRTVTLGTQTWMAENLNDAGADGSVGRCNRGDSAFCKTYGRLYTWAEAMGIDRRFDGEAWGGSAILHQGICPSSWHVPNDSEWNVLLSWVNSTTGASTPGKFLKSTNGWTDGAGSDRFGFRVLAGGQMLGASSSFPGNHGIFWSASQGNSANWSKVVNFPSLGDSIMRFNNDKGGRLSVRCIKDS